MFSFEDYQKIIRLVKESGRAANFREALTMDRFIIVRHDVEFSVDRAYEISLLESEMDFCSTFFFQWTNNSYNILSKRNMDKIKQMYHNGHKIGLHYAVCGLMEMGQIRAQIAKEMRVLSEMFEFEISEFSIHRPSGELLRENIHLPGVLNAYQDDFFTFAENVTADTPLKVRYFSDAQHRWNYGLVPDAETLEKYDKIQILTHPYSWTREGYDNLENFRYLVRERNTELLETIDSECRHFAAVRDLL